MKNYYEPFVTALLILLWVYAAMSKLLDYETARSQMLNQVFPRRMAEILAWAVPVIELIIAGLLISARTRIIGIMASLTMLISFTVYIALIKLQYFGYVPCSCGGIISKLSWEEHFLFNMFFIVLSGIALFLELSDRHGSSKLRSSEKYYRPIIGRCRKPGSE